MRKMNIGKIYYTCVNITSRLKYQRSIWTCWATKKTNSIFTPDMRLIAFHAFSLFMKYVGSNVWMLNSFRSFYGLLFSYSYLFIYLYIFSRISNSIRCIYVYFLCALRLNFSPLFLLFGHIYSTCWIFMQCYVWTRTRIFILIALNQQQHHPTNWPLRCSNVRVD